MPVVCKFLSVYAQECRVEKGDIDDEGSVVKVDIEEENGERKQENERRIPCNFMNSTIWSTYGLQIEK